MLNFLLFLLSPIFALAGATNLVQPPNVNPNYQQNYSTSASCWTPEAGVTLDVSAGDLDSVHNSSPLYQSRPVCHGGAPFTPYGGGDGLIGKYTRVRQNVILLNYKIDLESVPFIGGCARDSASAMRWVGNVTDNTRTKHRLFWENTNRKGQKMFDFVFVESAPPDKKFYYFDAYARDSILANPAQAGYQFILDCQTKGGIVPVVENNSNLLPPQVVAFTELSQSALEKSNYNRFAIAISVTPQAPGTIGPTLPPTYELFPPYMNYLIKVDQEDLPPGADPNGDIGTVTRTANGITHVYNVYFHAGSFYLKDQADNSSYVYDPSEDAPSSSLVRNPSLQLGVLQFKVTYEWNPYIPTCKPAIYLYPAKPTDLSVQVVPDGKLTKSVPDYNGGWNVRAYPDGRIESGIKGQELGIYPYLYYEANIQNVGVPKDGFVVAREDLTNFFNDILPKVGLNVKEAGDFKDYWVQKLTDKPYYFITLLDPTIINEKEKLVFSQNPDTLIRVRFEFEGLDAPISVKPLVLPQPAQRSGFTAVDWGGGIIGGSCENGTVSNQVMK